MKNATLLSGLLLSLAGMSSAAFPADDAQSNAKARMDAARKVYKALLARSAIDPNVSSVVYDQLYRWSCRWMEAQVESGTNKEKLSAVEGHVGRMRELDKMAQQLLNKKLIAPYEVSAIEFYRLDAEKRLRAVQKK
jgi:hypothetical protein